MTTLFHEIAYVNFDPSTRTGYGVTVASFHLRDDAEDARRAIGKRYAGLGFPGRVIVIPADRLRVDRVAPLSVG